MAPRLDVGVILAGGASGRMGSPKALLSLTKSETFLSRLVETLTDGGCSIVIVVAGRHVREIAAQLPEGALLARNAGWARGQLSSASVGISAALRMGAGAVLLHPVDQPLITVRDVKKLRVALGRGGAVVAAHAGATGHPLLLRAGLARRIAADGKSETLRAAVERVVQPERVACSAGCLRGANDPSELRALLTEA